MLEVLAERRVKWKLEFGIMNFSVKEKFITS